jgi:hypothetical protein
MFNDDLRYATIIGSKRRVNNQIKFDDGNTSIPAPDCWTLTKTSCPAVSTIFSRALAVLPDVDNRGQQDCSICCESMEGKETFSCPNKHQIHLECWNNWTRSSGNRRCVVCRCDTATATNPSREHLGHHLVLKPDYADDRAIGVYASRLGYAMLSVKMKYFVDTLFRCPITPKITEVCPHDATKIIMKKPVIEDYAEVLTYFRTPENIAYLRLIRATHYNDNEMNDAKMLTHLRQDYGSERAYEMIEANLEYTAKQKLKNDVYIKHYVIPETDAYYIDQMKIYYERILLNTGIIQNVSVA